jgi:hypothetical protein
VAAIAARYASSPPPRSASPISTARAPCGRAAGAGALAAELVRRRMSPRSASSAPGRERHRHRDRDRRPGVVRARRAQVATTTTAGTARRESGVEGRLLVQQLLDPTQRAAQSTIVTARPSAFSSSRTL